MRLPQGSGAEAPLVALQHRPDLRPMVSPATIEPGASAPLASHEIRRIIYGLMMAMLLGALDQTIVATALPTIGRDLGGAAHLPWVVTAYLLAATSAVPIYGKLSDIHGRRVVLLAAIVIFAVGSVLCGLAPSMPALVAARFVQGIGGGGLLALSQTIVGDMLSPRERAGWQVYFATAFTTASVAGPVLGGFFAQHLTWQMIFWINVPLSAAAYLMTATPLRRLAAPRTMSQARRARRSAVDRLHLHAARRAVVGGSTLRLGRLADLRCASGQRLALPGLLSPAQGRRRAADPARRAVQQGRAVRHGLCHAERRAFPRLGHLCPDPVRDTNAAAAAHGMAASGNRL